MRIYTLGWLGLLVTLIGHDAEATAVFARQTGMACSSCHFQHFPLLNGFGRAFKSAGFSMIGAQSQVQSDDLSIPSSLNMSVVAAAGFEKSNQSKAAAILPTPEKNAGDGVYYTPGSGGELSMFFGGRVSENAGFVGELSQGIFAGVAGSAKMPIQFDLTALFEDMQAGTRIGLVTFATDMHGASYGFEELNTGANDVQLMTMARGFSRAHSSAVSAQQYIDTDGAAKGLAFVVSNPKGFINVTKYDRTGISLGKFAALGSTYLRVAGFIPLPGWEAMAVGAQAWSGNSATRDPAGLVPLVTAETQAYAFDAQLQGHLGDMPLGLYASYARAPAVAGNPVTGNIGNAYNTYLTQDAAGNPIVAAGIKEKTSLNISAELGIVPEVATFGIAARRGVNGNGLSDNAVFLFGSYQIVQNIMLSLSFTNASGDYWYSDPVTFNGTTDQIGKTTYTINLSSIF